MTEIPMFIILHFVPGLVQATSEMSCTAQ